MSRKKKERYYTIKHLLDLGKADSDIRYFLSFGQRAAGKSYSTCEVILENYMSGHTTGICRRWQDDFGQSVGSTYFDALVANNRVREITKNEWENVYYYGGRWYLTRYEEDKVIKDKQPFAYAFGLNTYEKSKASNFPSMNLLVFEEFISDHYIGGGAKEFGMFLNLISTLKRDRDDFKCILLGNTIARRGNPYFIGFGIEKSILKMKPGECIVFKNDSNRLKIAAEFTRPHGDNGEGERPDIMFDVFTDNASARMITHGDWEVEAHFPILPQDSNRLLPKDVLFRYYLIYRDSILQADVILRGDEYFTYFQMQEREIDYENDLIFDLDFHLGNNFRRDILAPTDRLTARVADLFKRESVYVQDVEVGEILYSYLKSL